VRHAQRVAFQSDPLAHKTAHSTPKKPLFSSLSLNALDLAPEVKTSRSYVKTIGYENGPYFLFPSILEYQTAPASKRSHDAMIP